MRQVTFTVKSKCMWSKRTQTQSSRWRRFKRSYGTIKVTCRRHRRNRLISNLYAFTDMTIISTDMRDFTPPDKADILVSELLGSFGDNELSPECLDGAQKHLKCDGISIPCQSTSYLNPVMSPKILAAIREVRGHMRRGKITSFEKQSESPYVVYLKNVYHITKPQPVFTFVHPNRDEVIDNTRFVTLEFQAEQDCMLTGFAGYFDTVLYKDIVLSIHPEFHTKGLISWFSLYFPLSEPQQVRAGETIRVQFWRCISSRKVWYEWSTSSPNSTHVHNIKGWAAPIYKWSTHFYSANQLSFYA